MNDRDLRLRCVELAAVVFASNPSLDVVHTAERLFLYVSSGNASDVSEAEEDFLSKFNEGKGC